MKKIKCKKCPKEIEGYSVKHVRYLMEQHMLTHRKEEIQGEDENK